MDRGLVKALDNELTRQVGTLAIILLWISMTLYLHVFVFSSGLHVALLYAVPIVLAGQVLRPAIAVVITALAVGAHSIDSVVDKDPFLLWFAQTLVLLIIAYLAIRGKEQERAQRRLAAELDATISSIAEGILVHDPSGRIVRMNSAAEDIFQFSAREQATPLEERLRAVRPENARGQPQELSEAAPSRALRGEVVRGQTLIIHRPSNRTVWISVSAAPVRIGDGALLGAVVSVVDITALHALQDQLEDVLRSVSHDLRTPLTVILGHAQLLEREMKKGRIDGSEVRGAEAIVSESRRMNSMIQDLVDNARMESGQLRLKREPVDVKSFVAALLQRSAPALDVKRVRLDAPDNLPPLAADPDKLDRILVNLLSNALKYSTPGAEVLISARQSNHSVAISVSDHGPGISAEDLPHVFERFYRASATRGKEGLGLGLFTARMLVEAQSGRIWAVSRPGEGSTFTVELPIWVADPGRRPAAR